MHYLDLLGLNYMTLIEKNPTQMWNLQEMMYFLVWPMLIWKLFKYYVSQFSCSVMSDSLQLHEPQHTRPPCPSPTPRVHPNSCPLNRWCHPTISSSVVPFSSCPQSFPALGSFQMSQFFASGGQCIGASALKSIFPMYAGVGAHSYPTLCDPMDCSPRGSSVHGILQARVLEWVEFPPPESERIPAGLLQLLHWAADSLQLSLLWSPLSIYIEGWFPLGLTGSICWLCKGLWSLLQQP